MGNETSTRMPPPSTAKMPRSALDCKALLEFPGGLKLLLREPHECNDLARHSILSEDDEELKVRDVVRELKEKRWRSRNIVRLLLLGSIIKKICRFSSAP